ncbi:hypothetical protein HU200_054930 [Digitaria exilis]|uniref:Protein kinase domain-containing protein n=1 Tax=Digitaria exilis TaxID=1010633 RepID=A0A835ANU9_9POAL|nr:hypothetical protein HU200_054930 [Digitaria exilis]
MYPLPEPPRCSPALPDIPQSRGLNSLDPGQPRWEQGGVAAAAARSSWVYSSHLFTGQCIDAYISSQHDTSKRPVWCIGCGQKSVVYIKDYMKLPLSEIQAATSDFSKENLLDEFGHVYKGQLNDGQLIAAKLRKETNSQGHSEFFNEVQVLSFARHRNIVALLGYCCEETYNILVYEYICNRSLEWHLFGESSS